MIKNNNFEGNLTDAAKVANNVESANVPAKTEARPRGKKASPVYSVLKKARAQYDRQVDHNTETKRKCIEENIKKYYADPLRFWLDFKDETNVLIDSISFNKTCANLRLIPGNVAEHIVFEGKSVRNNVRDNGLNVLGEQVKKFNAPLFVDSEGLYQKQITAGSGNLQAGNAEKMEAALSVLVEKPVA